MEVRFFNPGKSYREHHVEMLGEIDRVLTAGDLVLRDDLLRFEGNLARYVGKRHAIGVNSGTDALYLSLWALGIGPGDEVIVPSHTFVATVQVVHQLGATPVLVDVEDDMLMHGYDVHVNERTRAIIPVHLTGAVADISELHYRGVAIIEDAAQALGATGVGFGVMQCWSFYPAKILGAYGDAGAITTDDDMLADELRQLRHHYKRDYSTWGINSRLDNLQAAVLNVKMKYLAEAHLRRAIIAERYREGFKNLPLGLPWYQEGRVWQDYVVRTERRDELYDFLKEKGIETMKNEYRMPIKKLPNSIKIEHETLRLPCNDVLDDNEIEYVIKSIQQFYEAP